MDKEHKMTEAKDERPIVVFDSGVGGLTVLHLAMEQIPNENYIYYADIANVPYGTKSKTEVKQLLNGAFEEMMQYQPKAIVIACNTATSVSVDTLRAQYNIPIIGMEPAVRPAVSATNKKVLVFATDLTLSETKYQQLVQHLNAKEIVESIPMPELVEAAENYDFGSTELINQLKKKLSKVDWSQFDTLVLGCTHFVYFYPLLLRMLPSHIKIVDGNKGTINRLQSLITPSAAVSPQPIICLLSGQQVSSDLIAPYLNYLDSMEQLIQMSIHHQN